MYFKQDLLLTVTVKLAKKSFWGNVSIKDIMDDHILFFVGKQHITVGM